MRSTRELVTTLDALANGGRIDFPPSWLGQQVGLDRVAAAGWLLENLGRVPGLASKLMWMCPPERGGCGSLTQVDDVLRTHPEVPAWRCPHCDVGPMVVRRRDAQVEFSYTPPHLCTSTSEPGASTTGGERGAIAPRRTSKGSPAGGGDVLTVGELADAGWPIQTLFVAPAAPTPKTSRWLPADGLGRWIVGGIGALLALLLGAILSWDWVEDEARQLYNSYMGDAGQAPTPGDQELGGD